MRKIAIEVAGLGKEYHIGGLQKNHDRLTDQLADIVAAPFRRAGKLLRGHLNGAAELDEQIWALRDVSFQIKPGEVVGIIGRNGAGKSTLLKILSGITDPTVGYADIYGRVGSLLEVGTGFHPELTGRENVYLNGAILGMKRVEIQRKLDEIVAFAEIDKFLDTPVKHYSSGMYVRLAFSVAAHLEPEILLVDEVLAVGDAAFQKKCLGKMDDVANEGRTVLFVSHNMSIIQTLCHRGIFLRNGTVFMDSVMDEVISTYLGTIEQAASQDITQRSDRTGEGKVKLISVEISDGRSDPSVSIATGRSLHFTFHVNGLLPRMSCVFTIYNHLGHPVTSFNSSIVSPQDAYDFNLGTKFVCEIDELTLAAGRYRINVAIFGDGELQDHIEGAKIFEVESGQLRGRSGLLTSRYGNVSIPHRWLLPDKR